MSLWRSREIVRETERGVVEFRQVEERWGGSEKQAGIVWRRRRARLQKFFEKRLGPKMRRW
jgi:hypothetical protein